MIVYFLLPILGCRQPFKEQANFIWNMVISNMELTVLHSRLFKMPLIGSRN